MLLANVLFKRARAHAIRQRPGRVGPGVRIRDGLEQTHGIKSLVGVGNSLTRKQWLLRANAATGRRLKLRGPSPSPQTAIPALQAARQSLPRNDKTTAIPPGSPCPA